MLTTFISALSAPMGQNEAGSIPSEEDSIFATSPECLIIRVITHAQERVQWCPRESTPTRTVATVSRVGRSGATKLTSIRP